MTGEERITKFLRVLSDDLGDVELRVTHEEIATDVGLCRQTVTTILKRLKQQGMVTLGYRSIRLGRGVEWRKRTTYDPVQSELRLSLKPTHQAFTGE